MIGLFLCHIMRPGLTRRSHPKEVGFGLLAFLLIVSGLSAISVVAPAKASAATVTATGTNASICNQIVNDAATGVSAERLANGDCLVKFSSAATIGWKVPSGVTNAKLAHTILENSGTSAALFTNT